jgi:hypothetical protein
LAVYKAATDIKATMLKGFSVYCGDKDLNFGRVFSKNPSSTSKQVGEIDVFLVVLGTTRIIKKVSTIESNLLIMAVSKFVSKYQSSSELPARRKDHNPKNYSLFTCR